MKASFGTSVYSMGFSMVTVLDGDDVAPLGAVGIIALAGLDAEAGIVMVLYLASPGGWRDRIPRTRGEARDASARER
jgi:hypothetical protein